MKQFNGFGIKNNICSCKEKQQNKAANKRPAFEVSLIMQKEEGGIWMSTWSVGCLPESSFI